MTDYIDGFVFPLPQDKLQAYKEVVEKVAEIWKEHGALDYSEFILDDPKMEGIRSFTEVVNEGEVAIFGWVSFESREARDEVNKKVASDPRMTGLIGPLMQPPTPIFDPGRMIYGGFKSFVNSQT